MRIAYIAAGAGGMYCGSCMHDNTLAAALIKKGHEVALIPTYTPLRTDESNVSIKKIFYGGINVYLQEKLALFRRTHWAIDKLFNRPALLNWVSRFSASTNAKDLGALTVSVLQGEKGHQQKELTKLIQWLKNDYQPEIVQLTNSMFVGMAREIKKELGVPVLCAMQGEDIFLEDLIEPYKSWALALLRERAQEVDGFIATSEFYADFMSDYIGVSRDKIHVVRLGINLHGHGETPPVKRDDIPFVVGYLARVSPAKGLHLLVEAIHLLIKQIGQPAIKLKVAGYLDRRDRKYLRDITSKVNSNSMNGAFEYIGEVDRKQKIAFLNSLHALSVPTTYKEPKGLYVLEALANGIPVVQPRHGAFPELIAATGGGILVDPHSPQAIAEGIRSLITDASRRGQLSEEGKTAVHRHFSDEAMAEATLQVYRQYL
ncbi:MAG: glycosyltransferase family 4 protein [candidate division KSB1 bacterium]|nr:glycosyltransferase family 4 protein [candidate division KSB1 bacterium]